MNMMNRLREIISKWGDPMPMGKPLPPHVQAVKIDPKFMLLHMMEAERPTKRDGHKHES